MCPVDQKKLKITHSEIGKHYIAKMDFAICQDNKKEYLHITQKKNNEEIRSKINGKTEKQKQMKRR